MPASLTVDGRTYSTRELVSYPASAYQSTGDNTATALEFCRDWLRGDSHFSLATSGTTGAPKPILLTRSQMEASARATAAALGLRDGMTSLVSLPTRYVAGRMMLVRGLVLGLQMTLVEPSANPMRDLLESTHVDFAAFVPLQMATMLDDQAATHHLQRMQAILVGGAPISHHLASRLSRLNSPVYHTYGMTETATHVALRRMSGPSRERTFRPLPGVQLRLDTRGCLAVLGPMTNNEWVQTNDLALLEADGSFEWSGRVDRVINSGGVKVQPETVERSVEEQLAALELPSWRARRFFVTGLPDPRLGQRVTLVVEGDPSFPIEERQLLVNLRERLGPIEAPRQILYIRRFVETSSAKVDEIATLASAGIT
jgi:O-succinylbenzoic acid--CoA ligase